MEPTKTNVQITQELLALVNARYDRTQQGADSESTPEADPTIKALLDELSLAGDGTPASVDRSDPYFQSETHNPELFRKAVQKLHDEANDIPEGLQKIFDKLLK